MAQARLDIAARTDARVAATAAGPGRPVVRRPGAPPGTARRAGRCAEQRASSRRPARNSSATGAAAQRGRFKVPLDAAGHAVPARGVARAARHPGRAHQHLCRGGAAAGSPRAVRAAGAAIGRNPLSIIVPCHRVLGRDGSLTGYAGGLPRKQALLRAGRRRATRTREAARPRRPGACSPRCGARSFLFMRVGAGDFGAGARCPALRVAGAALVLLPLLALRGEAGRRCAAHWRPIALVGVTNSALPFLLFSYAALSITAGLSSIFNATAPLFGALIAWLWLRDGRARSRIAGLAIGFAGVLGWPGDEGRRRTPGGRRGWAIVACLAASAVVRLVGQLHPALADRRAVAGRRRRQPARRGAGAGAARRCGSGRPHARGARPGPAWSLLAVLCTGLAYVLYFRLIAHIGPGQRDHRDLPGAGLRHALGRARSWRAGDRRRCSPAAR